jgi:hypothetical protein
MRKALVSVMPAVVAMIVAMPSFARSLGGESCCGGMSAPHSAVGFASHGGIAINRRGGPDMSGAGTESFRQSRDGRDALPLRGHPGSVRHGLRAAPLGVVLPPVVDLPLDSTEVSPPNSTADSPSVGESVQRPLSNPGVSAAEVCHLEGGVWRPDPSCRPVHAQVWRRGEGGLWRLEAAGSAG